MNEYHSSRIKESCGLNFFGCCLASIERYRRFGTACLFNLPGLRCRKISDVKKMPQLKEQLSTPTRKEVYLKSTFPEHSVNHRR